MFDSDDLTSAQVIIIIQYNDFLICRNPVDGMQSKSGMYICLPMLAACSQFHIVRDQLPTDQLKH